MPGSIASGRLCAQEVVMSKVKARDQLANVPELTPALGAAVEPVSLDDVDLAILDLLVRDARASQRRIAREVGMSPPAVAERIGRLERTGVIRGYRAELDRARLGFLVVVYVRGLGVLHSQHTDGCV